MVTDTKSNYASPQGKEFTLVAGRYAGILPSSRVLDVGCAYGDGVCNIVSEFRCRAEAVDINGENLLQARSQAEKRRIGHLISFREGDIQELKFDEADFDLILAEGGILSFLGREKGIRLFTDLLADRGWLAFSDLILLTDESNIPNEILEVFDHEQYAYESEASYRKMFQQDNLDVHIMTLVPQSGWDNYYAHMVRRLDDNDGFFASDEVKQHFHREIDIFYRLEGYRYLGYLFGLVRKK